MHHSWIDTELAQVALFEGLSKPELRHVSAITTRLDLPAGRVLIRQGAPGREFFVVIDGEVQVVQEDRLIATRGTGGARRRAGARRSPASERDRDREHTGGDRRDESTTTSETSSSEFPTSRPGSRRPSPNAVLTSTPRPAMPTTLCSGGSDAIICARGNGRSGMRAFARRDEVPAAVPLPVERTRPPTPR